MKRITKKAGEEAAMICAIAASTPDLDQSYTAIAEELDIDDSIVWDGDDGVDVYKDMSLDLAFRAWRVTQWVPSPDAEAHALIMSGWSPEDGAP